MYATSARNWRDGGGASDIATIFSFVPSVHYEDLIKWNDSEVAGSTFNKRTCLHIKRLSRLKGESEGPAVVKYYTRSVQKRRGLFELRGSSWFQENPLGPYRSAD